MKYNARFILALFGLSLGAVFQFSDAFQFDDTYNDFGVFYELASSPESAQLIHLVDPSSQMSEGRKLASGLCYSAGSLALVMGCFSSGRSRFR
jgi:hypothetical protein